MCAVWYVCVRARVCVVKQGMVRGALEQISYLHPLNAHKCETKPPTLGSGHGFSREASLAKEPHGEPLPDPTLPHGNACLRLSRGQTDPFVTESCLSEVYKKRGGGGERMVGRRGGLLWQVCCKYSLQHV